MPELSVPEEKCMKVSFKRDRKILKMFTRLPQIFRVRDEGETIAVYCPVGYEIRRDVYELTPLQFKRVYNKLRVERGRKLWKGDCIILDPVKDVKIVLRMAPSELELVKEAAKNAGENLSDYIRAAVFTRMARELGL